MIHAMKPEKVDDLSRANREHACASGRITVCRACHDKNMMQAYLNGVVDGLSAFAHWDNGTQRVGTCGTTLLDAMRDAEETLREHCRQSKSIQHTRQCQQGEPPVPEEDRRVGERLKAAEVIGQFATHCVACRTRAPSLRNSMPASCDCGYDEALTAWEQAKQTEEDDDD